MGSITLFPEAALVAVPGSASVLEEAGGRVSSTPSIGVAVDVSAFCFSGDEGVVVASIFSPSCRGVAKGSDGATAVFFCSATPTAALRGFGAKRLSR